MNNDPIEVLQNIEKIIYKLDLEYDEEYIKKYWEDFEDKKEFVLELVHTLNSLLDDVDCELAFLDSYFVR